VCRKIAEAVKPAGHVLLVNLRNAREHLHGWPSWALAFGADAIHLAFAELSGFRLVFEQWNDSYGISLFQQATMVRQNSSSSSGALRSDG
jgi:hypothetical protein